MIGIILYIMMECIFNGKEGIFKALNLCLMWGYLWKRTCLPSLLCL